MLVSCFLTLMDGKEAKIVKHLFQYKICASWYKLVKERIHHCWHTFRITEPLCDLVLACVSDNYEDDFEDEDSKGRNIALLILPVLYISGYTTLTLGLDLNIWLFPLVFGMNKFSFHEL